MRPNNFDLIRLLAAFQVVYCHSCWHLEITTGIGSAPLAWFMTWFAGVPIFFTVSGFLISQSWERTENWRDYATKRILRVYPALWVQLAVGITLAAGFGAITPSLATGRSFATWVIAQATFAQCYNPPILSGFGLGVLNGSLWTIPVEVGFYFSLPLLFTFLINRVRRPWADVGLVLFWLASFAHWYYLRIYADPQSQLTKLQMVTPFPYLHLFLTGVIVQRHFERLLPYLENRVHYWFAAFAICMLALNPWGVNIFSVWPLSVLLGRLLLSMTALSFAFSWRSLSDRLLRGNDISYGVYLYHMLVINTLIQVGSKGSQWQPGLVAVCAAFLGFLSWRLIEKPAVLMKSTRSLPVSETPAVLVGSAPDRTLEPLRRRAA